MPKLWKNREEPLLGFPSTWFYAETADGKFLLVPIGEGKIRL